MQMRDKLPACVCRNMVIVSAGESFLLLPPGVSDVPTSYFIEYALEHIGQVLIRYKDECGFLYRDEHENPWWEDKDGNVYRVRDIYDPFRLVMKLPEAFQDPL